MLKCFFISFSLLPILLFSQNQVNNGSMEDFHKCPDAKSLLHYAIGWFGYDSTASSCEYFNVCATSNSNVSIPSNSFGFQNPFHGNGYIGHLFATSTIGYNETSMGLLHDSLEKGQDYCVRMRVSLQDLSSYATDQICIYFSEFPVTWDQYILDTIEPQIKNSNGIIADTSKWTLIESSFTSQGGEKYFAIGNFYVLRPINIVKLPYGITNGVAAYYIDAVAVYLCNSPVYSASCSNDTTICIGTDALLKGTRLPEKYASEYEYLWFKVGMEQDTLSIDAVLSVSPDFTTTYVLKLTDFKYDVTYDTLTVQVVDCGLPTHVLVSPNPVHTELKLSFDRFVNQTINISIFNVSGQLIREWMFDKPEDRDLVLQVGDLASGVYICRIASGERELFTEKIIKL